MRVMLQQPRFLPWSGHWHKVDSADLHILYCGVQFDRTDYIHRVRIGEGAWLTIPLAPEADTQLICNMRLGKEYKFHFAKMAKTIRMTYMGKKWKYGDRLGGLVSTLENWGSDDFVETVLMFHHILSSALGLRSQLVIDTEDRSEMGKVEKIDSVLAKWTEGKEFTYLMGSGGENYMTGDELKSPSKVVIQQEVQPCYFGSILRNLARDENPMAEARECFTWRDL